MDKEIHQHINAPVQDVVAGGDVQVCNTVHNHTIHSHGPLHLHTHVEQPVFALQAPPAPPARYRQRNQVACAAITPAQKELLAMMRPLPKPMRIGVLDWMRSEFGTGLIKELDPLELQRTRRAVLDARRSAGL